jgi:hypothetical protein
MAIEAAKALRLHITALVRFEDVEPTADDLQTIQDSFEGETTLDAEIRNAVLAIEEDEILVIGIKARLAELSERRMRFEKRMAARRGLIEQAMAVVGLPKLQMDIGTVSCSPARPRVEVTDEASIPTQFWKRADPTLDKTGLNKTMLERHKAIVAAGHNKVELDRIDKEMPAIAGCQIVEEGFSLTIRRR